jgi:excisionase family DNA binding protein
VEEAGAALGISRSHTYELIRQGELPALRLGRRIVVPVAALEAVLQDTIGRSASLRARSVVRLVATRVAIARGAADAGERGAPIGLAERSTHDGRVGWLMLVQVTLLTGESKARWTWTPGGGVHGDTERRWRWPIVPSVRQAGRGVNMMMATPARQTAAPL